MNVFALDRDPVKAAQGVCDVHVTKMVTEAAQALCTSAFMMRYDGAPYKPYRINQDIFTDWLMRSRANWDWLIAHGFELHRQHQGRKGSQHKAFVALCWARRLDPYEHPWETEGLTPFADGTWPKMDPTLYPDPSVDLMVEMYREYYIRKEAVWAEKATVRALEFVSRGRKDISKGRRPTMEWSPPAARPPWMPAEPPDWRPTPEQIAEVAPLA